MRSLKRMMAMTLAITVFGQMSQATADVLVGINGAGGAAAKIFIVDSSNGSASELGTLNYNGVNLAYIAGMASNPVDGYLYFVNNTGWGSDAEKYVYRTSPSSLLSGNMSVERVVNIGGQDLFQTPDITFSDDGKLYVWTEESDDPALINLATGVRTLMSSDIGTWATGIAFDEEGALWVKAGDQLSKINLNADGNAITSEERNVGEINMGEDHSNMLTRAPDGSFWSGYRTDTGTIIYKFTPGTGDITATAIATLIGPKFAALEWLRGDAGKDRAFWNSVENCRLSMARTLSAGSDVSTSTYQSCFFTGVNSSNAAAVNAALKDQLAKAAAAGKPMSHADLMKAAAQIADRLDLVQRISTGKLVYAAEFAEVGISLGAHPTTTLDALKSLPSADIDTLDELLAAITRVAS